MSGPEMIRQQAPPSLGVVWSADPAMSVDQLVDGQAIGPRMLMLLALATLAMVSDGFDLSAIGYVGPELVAHWHVSREALVPMFTAGAVGLLIGAPALGMLGDRIGRKRAMIFGLGVLACASLLAATARSLGTFTALRFVTGLGLGGVIPNVIAYISEMVPKRMRGRFLVIGSLGVAAGVALPGLITYALVPRFGWQMLMLIGGSLPLALACAVALLAPESVKYLAGRAGRAGEARQVARRMRPDIDIGEDVMFRVEQTSPEAKAQRGSPRRLLAGQLAVATPLIWLLNATNQFTSFFILTWLPTLLQARGAGTAEAGLGGSLYSLGGLTSGVLLLLVIDRFGVVPLVLFCFAGAPLMAAVGPSFPDVIHGAIMLLAGLCVTGNNMTINALLGIVYPTSVRSAGVGWTQATGRLGAMVAPLVGGLLLSLHCSVQQLLLAPATALLVGGLASLALTLFCRRVFGGSQLREFRIDSAGNG